MSKILVVDDDPGVLRLLEYVLSHEGYQVLTASNGMEGLRVAQEAGPDLVVLDVMLPGIDGFEVCHRLRSGAGTAAVPVLMLSAKGQETDKDTGVRVGADEYLTKPVDRVELLQAVERLIQSGAEAVEKKAEVSAFVGTRGGVGTSTVVASVAAVLGRAGHRAVAVDLCPPFGALATLMGLDPKRGIGELFKPGRDEVRREHLEAVLLQHSSGARLLPGERDPEKYDTLTPAGMDLLLAELPVLADYVIIDMPSSPSETVVAALRKCNSVNLVTSAGQESQNRVSSAAALLSRRGVDGGRLGVVVVDRTGADADMSDLMSIGGYPVTGVIPFDGEECADAEARGVPVVLYAPLSPVAVALCRLAEKVFHLEGLTLPPR